VSVVKMKRNTATTAFRSTIAYRGYLLTFTYLTLLYTSSAITITVITKRRLLKNDAETIQ